MLSRKTSIYAIATIPLLLGVYILFTRVFIHPAMEWYTSAPLNAEGLRAKVLVPYGWTLESGESKLLTGNLSREGRVTLIFSEQESTFQRWLRRLLRQPAKPDASLSVDIAHSLEAMGLNPENPADGTLSVITLPNSAPFISIRTIKVGKLSIYGDVAYIDSDKKSFNRRHAAICKSFTFQ